ncbi:DoxX family protein [Rhodococcus sp. NPDC058521]|uniref:DoxX family protein n=1 Tax=Rhodococcus sp. NPDC058521 TaxID=3346536 RepID=UPI00364ACD0B
MQVVYTVVTAVAVVVALSGAWVNFTHHRIPVTAAEQVQVPKEWIRPIGGVFTVAAIGLLVGIVVRPIGVAAAIGLVFFFVCAIGAHVRVGDRHLVPPIVALALSITTLVVTAMS